MRTHSLFPLVFMVSCALAAKSSHDQPPGQDDVIELIKHLQQKYDSQLQEYASRLTSNEAKIEQYERRLYEYETKVSAQDARIKELEERLGDNKDGVFNPEERPDAITEDTSVGHQVSKMEKTNVKVNKVAKGRSRRLVLTDSEMPVAFYAQLTKDVTGVGNYQTIIFDLVTTNIGNVYNKADGIFTAPVNGVYVFIWTASNRDRSHMQTELVKNAAVVGRQWSDSMDHSDISSATGSAVLKLIASDTVWVRSNTVHSHVLMGSDLSSFSGWMLYNI